VQAVHVLHTRLLVPPQGPVSYVPAPQVAHATQVVSEVAAHAAV